MTRYPAVVSGLPAHRRAAFGAWARSVWALVAHLDGCQAGCTADQTRCADGDAIVDHEQDMWHAWRETC